MAEEVGKLVLAMGPEPVLDVLPRTVLDEPLVNDLVAQRRFHLSRRFGNAARKRSPSPQIHWPARCRREWRRRPQGGLDQSSAATRLSLLSRLLRGRGRAVGNLAGAPPLGELLEGQPHARRL